MTADVPTLEVEGLGVRYGGGGGFWGGGADFTALEDLSFAIAPGETLGLVGESGSGKTTAGRAILRRVPISTGRIALNGKDITQTGGEALRQLRADMQLVLQDPYASLNPRMRVLDIVAEPLIVHGRVHSAREARARVIELLDLVGLPGDTHARFPHAFSGGQRQRIGIARALALRPSLIVADEPVSALDVSVRAQVINLMQDLQRRFGLSYLFIAHDLSIVRHISHRVAILYGGRLMEIAGCEAIYKAPRHPYTRALLAAVPVADPALQRARRARSARVEVPQLPGGPQGCRYRARCPLATARCAREAPPLSEVEAGHRVACWHPEG